MPLVNPILHLFLRFVKLARLLLRFEFADDLLKNLHGFEAAAALVAFDVQLDLAGLADGNFKFALGIISSPSAGPSAGWSGLG